MEEKNRHISIAVLCAVALVALLLGLGLGLNALLLPEDVAPSAPTEPPTEPPTDPPTDPPTEPPTDPPTEPPLALPELSLTAKHGFLYVVETGEFLTIKGDMGQRIYPASITKLFSTYVALLYLEPDTKIVTGNEVYAVEADSSKAGLGPGLTLTVRELVQAMLLSSGSDASMALATAVGRKLENDPDLSYARAIARFVEEMNAVADTMGLEGSHFVNPDGYHHEDHYTTARDMQKMGTVAAAEPTLRAVMAMPQATPSVKLPYQDYPWINTNFLLRPTSSHYIDTAFGMKTGYTAAAGGCILAGFSVKGQTVIIGLFGCPNRDDRFGEVKAIYEAYEEIFCSR